MCKETYRYFRGSALQISLKVFVLAITWPTDLQFG